MVCNGHEDYGVDVLATNRGDQAKLQAEVLALRPSPRTREADQAGALASRRSDGSGGPPRTHLGRGKAGNGSLCRSKFSWLFGRWSAMRVRPLSDRVQVS